MGNKCKYPNSCEYKTFWKECGRGMACQHQTEVTNTPHIRAGPDQDGMWYKVDNEDYEVKAGGSRTDS